MSVWSGLGITAGQPYGSWFEFNSDTHEAIAAPFLPQITKFPRIRALREQTSSTSKVAIRLWLQDIKNHNSNIYCMYGTANSSSVYFPTYYATHLSTMLDDAAWAESNNIDAFAVGNEFETSGQRGSLSITSITRASNVSTVVTSAVHNLQTGDTVNISGANESDFNGTDQTVTVSDTTTFTYANAGSDGSATGTLILKPGDATIIRLVKALAVEAQVVFTGDIIYSFSQGYQTYWNATTITPDTDIDLLGLNVYGTSTAEFQSIIDSVFAVYGTQMIITEFNLHASWSSATAKGFSPSQRGFDPAYAQEIYERLQYIQNTGIEQAYFFAAWNASSSENNNFTAWYNTNTTTGNGGALQGGWKSVYDRLLGNRISHVFLGTQQST